MPQMAPIMWLPIFLVLIYIFILMKISVYFSSLEVDSVSGGSNFLYKKYIWLW